MEGQEESEDKIPEVRRATAAAEKVKSNSDKEAKLIRKVPTYSPPKRMHQRSR